MSDTDKILDAIAGLTQKVTEQSKTLADHTKRFDSLEDGQNRTHTILKVLPPRGEVEEIVDTSVTAAKNELKADILNLDAKVSRKMRSHERRIQNIEEHEGIENPDKN